MRRTKKYVAALATARSLQVSTNCDQAELYSRLQSKNFFWDSGDGRWVAGTAPDPATALVRIRVWASSETVPDVAEEVVRRMTRAGYSLVERSEPYQCRPPKQLESRVYLTFTQ